MDLLKITLRKTSPSKWDFAALLSQTNLPSQAIIILKSSKKKNQPPRVFLELYNVYNWAENVSLNKNIKNKFGCVIDLLLADANKNIWPEMST